MPQMGYDNKTDWLTDCQSQYDFDFDKNSSVGRHPPFIVDLKPEAEE
jgi:hypothetical protein